MSLVNRGKQLILRFGVDKAIGYTILTRIIQAAGGIFSVLFIAKFLSLTEQGYYYTFASILALQIFFELGLSSIITQYASYEFAHLSLVNDEVVGNEVHLSRLSSLLRFCVKWFSMIAIFLLALLLVAGFYFFNRFKNTQVVNWEVPWIILSVSTALNLIIDPVLAFFDGIGYIADMSKIRLMQKILNICLLFLFLFLGFSLYSAALASLLAILLNYLQIIFSKRRKILTRIWQAKGAWNINYMEEIFPYQWKIALSWISGYFIFYFFNPVLFATEGAIVAGQMGMTLAALNGISSISMSWINTKVPLFSSLIAKKEFTNLDLIFNKVVKQLAAINFLGLTTLMAIIFVLYKIDSPYRTRFLPIFPLIMLCTVTFINQYVGSWATYLRCFKKEPFLVASVVVAALCALSTIVLGNKFGMIGMVSGYTTIVICGSLPWAYSIYKTKSVEFQLL